MSESESTDQRLKQISIVLEETHLRYPNDREILYALVAFNRDTGNLGAARSYAEKLIVLSPQDPAARRLLDSLQLE